MQSGKKNIVIYFKNENDLQFIINVLEKDKDSIGLYIVKTRESLIDKLKSASLDALIIDSDLYWNESKSRFVFEESLPVIIIADLFDWDVAQIALNSGVQEYLLKNTLDAEDLKRSILYSIERHKHVTEYHNLSMLDELTGIYNRRGFKIIAEQCKKIADRRSEKLLFVYFDFDNLKQINDSLGHDIGDLALIETSNLMRLIFRKSDIIARIGGDEFAAIAFCTPQYCEETLIKIIESRCQKINSAGKHNFRISVSYGMSLYEPNTDISIDELIVESDKKMYKQKILKRSTSKLLRMRRMKVNN